METDVIFCHDRNVTIPTSRIRTSGNERLREFRMQTRNAFQIRLPIRLTRIAGALLFNFSIRSVFLPRLAVCQVLLRVSSWRRFIRRIHPICASVYVKYACCYILQEIHVYRFSYKFLQRTCSILLHSI